MRLSNGEVCLGWPLAQHVLTAGYYYSSGSLHAAIDFRAMEGTPVFAAEDGTVSMIHNWDGKRTEGDTNSYGNMVKLKHADYNGSTLETLYAHLNSISVKKGQAVKAGDLIGYSGNTGNSFGAHLHFEVRYAGSRRNPLVWLDNDFTTANSNVYTFGPGEHSVDKGTDCGGATSGNNGNMTGVSTANEHKGIDVSRYQGTIDWAKVAKAGIKFAMLRVVSSNNNGVYVDPTFEQNYKGATENGIPVGAYFFTYAKTEEAQNEEIEMMLKAFEGKTFQYPMLFNWAVSVCEYLAQYFESIPGEEKNKKAAEFIMEIAKQAGIELTEEQARSIAQAAYESLKNGGKDITEEKKEEGDVKKEVIANA